MMNQMNEASFRREGLPKRQPSGNRNVKNTLFLSPQKSQFTLLWVRLT